MRYCTRRSTHLAGLLVCLVATATVSSPLRAAVTPAGSAVSSARAGTEALLAARDSWQRAEDDAARVAAEQQMVRIAAARMLAMQRLMRVSPADAVKAALPTTSLATFPDTVQPYLESMQKVAGRLEVRWADYAEHAERVDVLSSPDGRWTLLYTRQPRGIALQSGQTIEATGLVVGDLMALDPSATTATTATSGTASTASLPLPGVFGEQRLLVVPVTFTANPATPYTVDYVRSQFFTEADAFYRDISGGRTWLAGDVTPWITLALDPAVCDIDSVATLADAAARTQGFDPGGYTRIAYVMPGMTCGWAGLAVTGPASPTRVWLTTVQTRVLIHELGHNLGLHHSRGRVCSGSDPWSSTCRTYEYGDLFDIMGSASASPFNAQQMRRLGYFDTTGSPQTTLVTAAGEYTIGTYAAATTLPRALRIPAGTDPATGAARSMYVTLRQPVGRDTALKYAAGYDAQRMNYGVEINAGVEVDGDSYLLDATPLSQGDAADLNDSPFLVGESFADASAGVTISPVQVVSGSARISVSFGGTPPASSPTNLPPVAVDDAATVASGGSVTIAVLSNDYDPEKAKLSVSSVSQPLNGQVTINADGTVVYRPVRKFTGTDTFSYVVSDGKLTDTGVVAVTVMAGTKTSRTR